MKVSEMTVTLRVDASQALGTLRTAEDQLRMVERYAQVDGITRLLEYIRWGTRTDGDYNEWIAKPWPSDIELARKYLRRRITDFQNLLVYWPAVQLRPLNSIFQPIYKVPPEDLS